VNTGETGIAAAEGSGTLSASLEEKSAVVQLVPALKPCSTVRPSIAPIRVTAPARMTHPALQTQPASQSANGEIYGALDLGTNNCRLLVARPSRRGFLVIDAFSRIIKLGEGVSHSGLLSEEAIVRTIDALKICSSKMNLSPE